MVTWTFVPFDYPKREMGSEVFVISVTPINANELGKTTPAKDRERQKYFVRLLKSVAWHLGTEHVPVFLDFNGEKRRMDKGCIGQAVAAGVLEAPKNGPKGYIDNVTLAAQPGSHLESGTIELATFKKDYREYVLSKYKQFELSVQSGSDKEYYFRELAFPPHMRMKHSFTKSSVVLVCEGPWKDVASTALANKIADSMRIELHGSTLHLVTRTELIDWTQPVEKQTHLIDAAMETAQRLLPYATLVQQAGSQRSQDSVP
jgi:hypothetical protein